MTRSGVLYFIYINPIYPLMAVKCSVDLFFKLGASILQSISSFLQVAKLPVPLQHVLHVLVHDPDDLVHLGLLLGHLPGRLDLTDLGGPWYRLPIWTQGPGMVVIDEYHIS